MPTQKPQYPKGISSFALHIIAMALMLLDHLYYAVAELPIWCTAAGRLAFPIFAFLLAEGFQHTRDLNRYILRMALFAALAEIPFNLFLGDGLFYPDHQSVLLTFTIALLVLVALRRAEESGSLPLRVLLAGGALAGGYLLADLLKTDYAGPGVLTVACFYLLRGRLWWKRLLLTAAMLLIHAVLLPSYYISLSLFGRALEFPLQALAVLALPLIWIYRGRQGPYNRAVKYCYYGFYPVHLLLIWLGMRLFF